MTDMRTQIVAETYDAIADRFAEWQGRVERDPRRWWAGALASRLPEGGALLELGCGAALVDTEFLADRFQVTGVDISSEQIARARVNAPRATFINADFTTLELEPESFEAVASFYAFNHVPRELLAGLFGRIRGWLRPGGIFLGSLGAGDTSGWTGEWLGATTFFSSYPPEINQALLVAAGFELEVDDVVTLAEPEGEASFRWVLARA